MLDVPTVGELELLGAHAATWYLERLVRRVGGQAF